MKIVFYYRDDLLPMFDDAINSGVFDSFESNEIICVYNTTTQKKKSRAKCTKYMIIEDFFKQHNGVYKLNVDTINSEIIAITNDEYNMFKVINNDRFLKHNDNLEYTTNLLVGYYNFWNDLFERDNPDFIINEIVSLMYNHIAAIIARKYGKEYIGFFENTLFKDKILFCYGDKGDFRRIEYTYRNGNITNDDVAFAKNYLDSFRKERQMSPSEAAVQKRQNFIEQFGNKIRRLLYPRLRRSLVFDTFDYVNAGIRKDWFKSIINTFLNVHLFYRDIQFLDTTADLEIKYFFPIHYEPEGVVYYWGGMRYNNQVELIFNIINKYRLDMLYVKDHLTWFGYRDANDYRLLNKAGTITLLHNKIKAMDILKNCKCVFAISGSSGVEGFLLGKHVINYGVTYYSFVESIQHVADIEQFSYQDFYEYLQKSIDLNDEDKIKYISASNKASYFCKMNLSNYYSKMGKDFAIALNNELHWYVNTHKCFK